MTFQTKNDLAVAMVQAVVSGQALRCRWFLADEVFGRDTRLLDATTPQALFVCMAAPAWTRHMLGDGIKGRRIADAVVQRVCAQREVQPGPEVWLILRRDPETGEQKAFLSNALASVASTRLAALRGMQWPIEQIFEVAKQQLGMGDYEVCSCSGWHHHMTLVILTHFFLVRLQQRLKKSPGAEPGAGVPAP